MDPGYHVDYSNLSSLCPVSEDEGPPINYSSVSAGLIVFIMVCIMCITILGNCLVILSILYFRNMRSWTNAFILSLGVADVLVAVIVMPFAAYNIFTNLSWGLGPVMCKVATCFDVMLTTTSILHLVCLAMDRYFAICNPFFYHERINNKSVVSLLIGCWTVPVVLSWLPIMNDLHTLGISDIIECSTPPDGRACIFLVNAPYAILASSIAFYAPTVLMIFLNYKIFQAAQYQAAQIRSMEMTAFNIGAKERQEKNIKQETKAAKTLSVIMGAFCTCWCPFFIFNVLDPFLGYKIPFTCWQLALWLGYINSTINPWLYYSFNRGFRRSFTYFIFCYKCRDRQGIKDNMMMTAMSNFDMSE